MDNKRGKERTPFVFSLHEIQEPKFQGFFLSCRRLIQFSDLSGQEQGLGFDVLVLQVIILSTLEDSVFFYMVLEALVFCRSKKTRNIKPSPLFYTDFMLCSPLSSRGFRTIPFIGHKCCVKSHLARAARSDAATHKLS